MVIVSSKWRDMKINVSPLFFKQNICFQFSTEFGQKNPSGNAFSELGSIETPLTTNGSAQYLGHSSVKKAYND